jgi:hypothetical protein
MAMALVAVLGLSGCSQGNTPTEYGTVTEQNFLQLCTNRYYDNTDDTLAVTDRTIAAEVNSPTPDQCKCQYDVYVAQMPINKTAASLSEYSDYSGPNFTDLNSSLKENQEEAWSSVPDSIKTALTSCVNGPSAADSTTTTAATTETTTAQ